MRRAKAGGGASDVRVERTGGPVNSGAEPIKGTRKRLDHIDAMRPIKQAAVISTHALIYFSPVGAGLLTIDGLVLTHFSREAFLFVSACMLAFSYRDHDRVATKQYWGRRFMAVGLPYLVWTLIYFIFIDLTTVKGFPFYSFSGSYFFSATGFHHLLVLTVQGYYHLYYLIVIMEFYVLFPVLLKYLKRWNRHHVLIMVLALAWQILFSIAVSYHLLYAIRPGFWQTRLVLSYPLYLIGGIVVALHLHDVHAWVVHHARAIIVTTVLFALGALVLNNFRHKGFFDVVIRPGGNPFAIMVIPYTVGAILCVYLLGVFLVSPDRSLRTRAAVKSGSDNSYGIYLSQLIWIILLLRVWQHFKFDPPFPIGPLIAVVIVYSCGFIFSALVARTPLARAVTGRSRTSWSTFLPSRRGVRAKLDEDTGDGPMDLEGV
jgi:peptidoglycan/LPS O-acetylase OafA/YrhL